MNRRGSRTSRPNRDDQPVLVANASLPPHLEFGAFLAKLSQIAKQIPHGANQVLSAIAQPQAKIQKQRGGPGLGSPLVDYLANSTMRVSRMTVTLIWPGYCSSPSMRLAISRARIWARLSSIVSGLTMIRISRPA